ncbi:hypothetical protein ACGFNU_35835 [Spirillospora sp. NPDC048911]|uniref:hypothetical protein n=1 Tax=Spirillospora sp. NPDC048911 TaxID=3364527 RepID=UPI00371D8728
MRGASARERIGMVFLRLALVCCVMAMHGLQASSSPADASGLPGVGVEHSIVGHGEAQSGGAHEPGRHSGGEICLALLTLVSFGALLLAVWRTWRPAILVPWSNVRPCPLDAGRSPPPLAFRSAVLRL